MAFIVVAAVAEKDSISELLYAGFRLNNILCRGPPPTSIDGK